MKFWLTKLLCHRWELNPLVHHRRHFGRMVHAMSNLPSLISHALSHMAVEGGVAEETLTFKFIPVFLVSTTSELMSPFQSQRKKGESSVWKTWGDCFQFNWLPPGVGFRWVCGYGDGRPCMFLLPMSPKPLSHLLKIQKGVLSARSDDTKSFKDVVLDWITPRGMPLVLFLSQNVKMNWGFHHPVLKMWCWTG